MSFFIIFFIAHELGVGCTAHVLFVAVGIKSPKIRHNWNYTDNLYLHGFYIAWPWLELVFIALLSETKQKYYIIHSQVSIHLPSTVFQHTVHNLNVDLLFTFYCRSQRCSTFLAFSYSRSLFLCAALIQTVSPDKFHE